LVPLYAAGLAAKDALRRTGLLPARELRWPVVSVGSLSAGGAGKTPVAIALAELLVARGWHVDILSRGYGREGRGVERVDPASGAAARRFGDEPLMIAQLLGVPVWVGADRFVAGTAAEGAWAGGREAYSSASLGNDNQELLRNDHPKFVHLLDDGFQHRQLARTMDVVLVTEEDLHDALLPAGNRREPLAAIRRADALVLRAEERERLEPKVRTLTRGGAAIWTVRRTLHLPPEPSAGIKPLAFCAIARPENFWAMLAAAGFTIADTIAFTDHHIYTAADMERLVKAAQQNYATGFLTTEKDAVKLSTAMLERLRRAGPVGIASLDAKFVDEAEVMRAVEALIS
jgi:tetraacyldisaccharide 4'-kinase